MSRLHEKWKAAKAKVRYVNVQQMFRMDFGSALDTFDRTLRGIFNRVFPDGKTNSTPLTYDQINSIRSTMAPLSRPVGRVSEAYIKAIVAARNKIQEKHRVANALEKLQLENVDRDWKLLLTELTDIQATMMKDIGNLKDRLLKLSVNRSVVEFG